MKQTRADPPTVLVAIDLAYQNGRDYYAGILRHLETARRRSKALALNAAPSGK